MHTVLYSRDNTCRSVRQYCTWYNCTTCSIVAPCETKCAGCGFIRKKLVASYGSRSKALMVHLYHIVRGWFSVLISCIQSAKPYVDSELFSRWFTQQRLPMAAETMALLIARQVLGQYSPNRARSRHLKVRTAYASPTAFGAAISDIPPRHRRLHRARRFCCAGCKACHLC